MAPIRWRDLNGQLKPTYNIQISTENQIITHYSTHQKSTDFTTLESHFDGFEKAYEKQSKQVIADAGYGSKENYQLPENKQVDFFLFHITCIELKRPESIKRIYFMLRTFFITPNRTFWFAQWDKND